jgi:hypothetical protein
MVNPAFKLIRELLDGGTDDMRELRIYEFQNDSEAHDDELQAKIAKEFETEFEQAQGDLSKKFGLPVRTGKANDPAIPLSGIFRCAVWRFRDREFFLAAAHEDREAPFLLMMGVESGNV